MFFAGAIKVNANNNLYFNSDIPTQTVELTTESPTKIIIESAQINLPIFQTNIINRNWEISKEGASHLDTSANPGEGGNIIIYAHNTKNRFGNLHDVKVGDVIKVSSKNDKTYTYEVKTINVVNPNDPTLIMPGKREVLTIYTCTGFADLKRLVIQAEPTS